MADNIEVPVNASACRRIEYDISVSYSEDPTLLPRLDELNGEVIGVTSSAKLAAALESKAAVASAIEAKGVEVANAPFAEYAAKIREIKAETPKVEGTPGNGFPVRFFDYDGTLLKTHYVHKGEDAMPPVVPEHEYLSFQQWNNDYTNIQGPTDTGALYDTKDGASYFFVRVHLKWGEFKLPLTVTNGTCYIDWGDGTTPDTNTGTFIGTHTYESTGYYKIKISASEGASLTFDNVDTGKLASSSERVFISSVFSTVTFRESQTWRVLRTMAVSPVTKCVNRYGFKQIQAVIMNNNEDICYLRYSVPYIFIPSSSYRAIFAYDMESAALRELVLPEQIKNINIAWGTELFGVIVIRRTVPPPLNAVVPHIQKIYVPEGSLSAYQSATNWSAFADIMEEFTEETILW